MDPPNDEEVEDLIRNLGRLTPEEALRSLAIITLKAQHETKKAQHEKEMEVFRSKLDLRVEQHVASFTQSSTTVSVNDEPHARPSGTFELPPYEASAVVRKGLTQRATDVLPLVLLLFRARTNLMDERRKKKKVQEEQTEDRSVGQIEKCFTHPIAHTLFPLLSDFLPNNVFLYLEPLSKRAKAVLNAAKEELRKKVPTVMPLKSAFQSKISNAPEVTQEPVVTNVGSKCHRFPDGGFYHSEKPHSNRACIARNMIFPLEFKRAQDPVEEAKGLLRDRANSKRRVTHGLGGDGRNWSFFKLSGNDFTAPFIKLCTTDVSSIVALLLKILKVLDDQVKASKTATYVSPPEFPIPGFQVQKIINLNKNSFVLQMKPEQGEDFVIKLDSSFGRKMAKTEQEILQEMESAQISWNAVKLFMCEPLSSRSDCLCMEGFGGQSLDKICLCDPKTLSTVREVVQRDIVKSLAALHEKYFVFGDLHPGNILIVGTGEKMQAILCDFESIRPFGPYPLGQALSSCNSCSNTVACWRHTKMAVRKGFRRKAKLETTLDAEHDLFSLGVITEWLEGSHIEIVRKGFKSISES